MAKRVTKKVNNTELDGKEFFAAIAQIEQEKGIKPGYMMEKISQALLAAYRRDHEGVGDNLVVDADPETNTVRMFLKKDVVETVDNPATEMSLTEAREKLPRAELGDVIRIEIKTRNFGRIAAQTARQEDHVASLDGLTDLILRFLGCLAAHFRIAAGTQSLRRLTA